MSAAKDALDAALGAASAQPGPAWARIRVDLDDLRRRLVWRDDRVASRWPELNAIDAVYDAVSALREVESKDDADWPVLRDARLAGIVRVLREIEAARRAAA
jgi:hypothetical protein